MKIDLLPALNGDSVLVEYVPSHYFLIDGGYVDTYKDYLLPKLKEISENGGAMKRMNMFLRWMVRKSPVDLGIWDFIKPQNLLIPLDVHVARVSRKLFSSQMEPGRFLSTITYMRFTKGMY